MAKPKKSWAKARNRCAGGWAGTKGRPGSVTPTGGRGAGEGGGVDDAVGLLAPLLEDAPLLDDRGGDSGAALERMAVARLAEAPDEHVVASLEEEDLRRDAPPLQCSEDRAERNARISRSDVEDEGHALESSGLRRDELGQARHELGRQVVHDGVAEVLEELARGRFPRAGQATDDPAVLRAMR